MQPTKAYLYSELFSSKVRINPDKSTLSKQKNKKKGGNKMF
ncbi:hypothetical protein C7382_10494 [Porphyromonas loveana]|uniref:Uncharacterized protein n=1 Tax=Porphyromonas loveana TaxID=1884669 RepID=A0A2U1FKU1_9PORP|nr:hypothetical protein C7382_10494 [Porphyromonas loveana]